MKVTAAVLREANGPFTIEQIELDPPGAGEVLVRIVAVGICHTDMVFASGAMGTPMPLILGHEGAGIVEAVGEGVTKVGQGDKVLLTFDSCGHCPRCADHSPAYCQQFTALNFAGVRPDGSTPARSGDEAVSARFFGQSSFASHAIAHARNVVPLAPDADLARLAPLGCGIQTGVGAILRSLDARPGSSLVVMGGGAVGLSAVMGGVLAGCDPIIVIEPRADRREIARGLGAHHAFDPNAGDAAAAVRALVPAGVDHVFDTSGHVGALQSAMEMLGSKGTLGMVGVPGSLDAVLPVPIVPAIGLGISVKGIIEGDSDPDEFLPRLVEHHAQGRLPFDRFVRFYPFDQINEAIADAHGGRCVKAVLLLDPA